MIIGEFYLKNYGNWHVKFFLAVSAYYTDEIIHELENIECEPKNLKKAYTNLSSGHINTGLTYTNPYLHESVMVIGIASCGEQFVNSLVHESKHLEAHIGKALGLDPYSEDTAYLAGEIAQKMYRFTDKLTCHKCRTLVTHNSK